MVGRTLGHYEVVALLGAGGMGEVYLARDTKLGREVALKVLPPALGKDAERRARFEREAKAVASLRHPGIVTIHSIEESGGIHFMTMELIEGHPLSDEIPSGGMALDRFLPLALHLADAVGAAHARGITHRDLKPANVMIDAAGRLKVLDFGLAKPSGLSFGSSSSQAGADPGRDGETVDIAHLETAFTSDLTEEGRVIGTVHYMSPEQAEGRTVSPRSDVFALGILLYEMATGVRPFVGDSSISILSSILRDEPVPIPEKNPRLPLQVGEIVVRCLSKNPSDRFADANELRYALDQLRAEASDPSMSDPSRLAASSTALPRTPLTEGGAGSGTAVSLGSVPSDSGTPTGNPPAESSDRSVPGAGSGARGRRAPIVVGVVLGAVLLAFLPILLRKNGSSPQESGIGASGRPSVAVLQFRTFGGDEEIRWLESGVPSLLLTGLAQTPGLDVVSSARVEEILEKIGKDRAAEIDRALVAEVARRSGAGAVVIGSIFRSGDEIRIDVQVEDVESGRILFARDATGRDVFPLVDQLAAGIREGLELGDGGPERSVAEVVSTSLEAYRAYDAGQQALVSFRLADAAREFERALDLDPDFAMVDMKLAELARVQGRLDESRTHLERAHELAHRLPERERYLVEADYQYWVRRDEAASTEALETLLSKFPDEVDAYLRLSAMDRQGADPTARVSILEKGIAEVPKSGTLRNQFAYTLVSLGRYDEALQQLEVYAQLEPEEVNPRDSMGELLLTMGRVEDAREAYRDALTLDPTFPSALRGVALANAMLGDYDDALAEFGRSIDSLRESGLETGGLHAAKAYLLLMVGRYEEARREAEKDDPVVESGTPTPLPSTLVKAMGAFGRGDYEACIESARFLGANLPKEQPEFYRQAVKRLLLQLEGTAEARRDRVDSAESVLSQLTALGPHPLVPWGTDWLRGEIELAKGDVDGAETAFQAGTPKRPAQFTNSQVGLLGALTVNMAPSRDWEARVRAARGDVSGAVDAYRRVNTPGPGTPLHSLFEPRYVLAAARLLASNGDPAAAAAEYERFLDYWKHADEGLPELAEARAYLEANRR
ncbi:MAG: protein kinase [Candidatus Eisenbacteria bacterium]